MYQFNDIAPGAGGGAAALTLDRRLQRPSAPAGFGHRVADMRARAEEFELVVDLGRGIGSVQWLRGLLTCGALCYAAWSLAPEFAPLPAPAAMPLPEAHWQEARSLAIAPLALGADTGRRMAPTVLVEPLAETPERPSVELVATLARGDGFASALERAGVSEVEAARVADMVARAVPLGDLRSGTRMDVRLGRRPSRQVARPLDDLSFRARFDLHLQVSRVDGRLVLTRIPIAVDETPLRVQGRVGASLYRSARAAGAPPKAVEAYLRALGQQVNLSRDVSADDRFDIIVEHRRAATGETEVGKLLFVGLERARGKNVQLMEWAQNGRAQWFEASGVGRQTGTLRRPVPGAISSQFGNRRHPILGYNRMHRGVDFRAAHGTPIVAAADGRVTMAGRNGGYGNTVRLAHAGGLATLYAHMSRISVRNGQQVRQGQVIGHVGSTGLSTGPHLHYELYRNGQAINPTSVSFVTQSQLSGSDLANFRSRLRTLLGTPVAGQQRAETETATTAG